MKKVNREMVNAKCTDSYDMFSDLSDAEKMESRICAEIASVIIRKRQRAAMSQAQLAEKLGVQQPMISQLESGDYNYTVSKISQIAAALDLDVRLTFSDKTSKCTLDSSKIISFCEQTGKYPIRKTSRNTSFPFTEIMEG